MLKTLNKYKTSQEFYKSFWDKLGGYNNYFYDDKERTNIVGLPLYLFENTEKTIYLPDQRQHRQDSATASLLRECW